MRRQLVRTTAYAVIAAMLVVLFPLSVLGVWVVTQPALVARGWRRRRWTAAPQVARRFPGGAGHRRSPAPVQRLSRRLTEPLTELVEAAEKLGQGTTRLDPIRRTSPRSTGSRSC